MSKIIKSRQFVEAHPCRLEPVDVDAFFINNPNPVENEANPEPVATADTMADPTKKGVSGTGFPEASKPDAGLVDESGNTEPDTAENSSTAAGFTAQTRARETSPTATAKTGELQGLDLEHLANVAGQISSLIENSRLQSSAAREADWQPTGESTEQPATAGGNTNRGGDSSATSGSPAESFPATPLHTDELTTAAKKEAESIFGGAKAEANVLRENAKKEAESIFGGAKAQANVLKETAKKEAESIFGSARLQAKELKENARIEAESLLEGSRKQLSELTAGAEKKASTILSGAQKEAETITRSANREADSIVSGSKRQADLLMEATREKAAKLMDKIKQQADTVLADAQAKADQTVTAAKQEAEQLQASSQAQASAAVEAAKQEVAALREQARQEGLETGRQDAVNQVKQELNHNLTTALSLVVRAEAERVERIKSSETELLKLAVEIAEKIVGAELELDPARQLDIVHEALLRAANAESVEVRVHPDDLAICEQNLPQLQQAFSEPKPLRFTADPGLTPGSCFIETNLGNVDARLKPELDMILTELLKARQI